MMTAPADDDTTARLILRRLHGLDDPMPADLAVAVAQVIVDPEGSRILAAGASVPAERNDLRRARSDGVYLAPRS